MIRMVNLTTHSITVYDGDSPVASWAPSGQFARAGENCAPGGTVDTDQGVFDVTGVNYTEEILDLPDELPGTAYIVSRVLAEQVRRQDLYFPFDEVREKGQVVGCRGFGRFEESSGAD
jgi:hypothetical protein